jgi:IS1 family transposase
VANVLPAEKRLRVLVALVEGNSEIAIERMTGVNAKTVSRFAMRLGEGAARLHNRLVRDLSCSLIEMDEVWSYVAKKQARVTEKDGPDVGDAYSFVALDQTSRLVIAYHVGKRDQENTDAFMGDLRSRLLIMPALVSDGFPSYPSSVSAFFGRSVDYAQLHKTFKAGGARDDDYRTEQPRNPIVTKHAIFGSPNMSTVSTSYMERNNGTMRHHIGRMRRMVYAFSRKLDHHRAAVALCYAWYNFASVVKTLRVSPSMAAGIADHIFSPEEFMDAVLSEVPGEALTPKPLRHRVPEVSARELRNPSASGVLRSLLAIGYARERRLRWAPTRGQWTVGGGDSGRRRRLGQRSRNSRGPG